MSESAPEELVTVQEAADILGVSIATVHRRIEDEALPTVRKLAGLRGAYLLNRADVEALLTDGSAA